LNAASSVTAGEKVLDSMAIPAIAIRGSGFSFSAQEKRECKKKLRTNSFFIGKGFPSEIREKIAEAKIHIQSLAKEK
jgi:hypothetical protein